MTKEKFQEFLFDGDFLAEDIRGEEAMAIFTWTYEGTKFRATCERWYSGSVRPCYWRVEGDGKRAYIRTKTFNFSDEVLGGYFEEIVGEMMYDF